VLAHTRAQAAPATKDYGAVKQAVADLMDVDGYDDGSYGPVLVRLAWHASGSYDAKTNTGGSNGATMRCVGGVFVCLAGYETSDNAATDCSTTRASRHRTWCKSLGGAVWGGRGSMFAVEA
jgi:hypothetical protein